MYNFVFSKNDIDHNEFLLYTTTLSYLRTGGITNSTEKLSKFYDIVRHREGPKIVQWWTGIMRFNETHFQNQSSIFAVPKRRLCKDDNSVYPFRSSVILSLLNGVYTAVSNSNS